MMDYADVFVVAYFDVVLCCPHYCARLLLALWFRVSDEVFGWQLTAVLDLVAIGNLLWLQWRLLKILLMLVRFYKGYFSV
jgi:hypothetical protein